MFDSVVDFKYIDAPHDVVNDDPPRSLLLRGFHTPFKSWMKIGEWKTNTHTGELEQHSKNVAFGIEESIRHVLEEMK